MVIAIQMFCRSVVAVTWWPEMTAQDVTGKGSGTIPVLCGCVHLVG